MRLQKATSENKKLETQAQSAAQTLKQFGDISKQISVDIQRETAKSKKSDQAWVEELVKLNKEIQKLKGVDVAKELAESGLKMCKPKSTF